MRHQTSSLPIRWFSNNFCFFCFLIQFSSLVANITEHMNLASWKQVLSFLQLNILQMYWIKISRLLRHMGFPENLDNARLKKAKAVVFEVIIWGAILYKRQITVAVYLINTYWRKKLICLPLLLPLFVLLFLLHHHYFLSLLHLLHHCWRIPRFHACPSSN